MESIKDKVAIVGMGCTKFGERWDKSREDLIVDATYEALADAGIETKDIQAAWVGTQWSNQSGRTISAPLKLPYIPVTRVENMCATGSDALRNACYSVAAGAYDIVLVVGVEKLKDTGFSGLPNIDYQLDPALVDPDMTGPSMFALLGSRYFNHYGLSAEEGKKTLAKIAAKNHHNGSMNPRAHFQREITVEQAMNAPIIAWPLGLFDCCGVSDGAAAAIVVRADMARKFRSDPVYIKALSLIAGPAEGGMRPEFDFMHIEENVRAGQSAYAQAGIKNPFKELSLAEVHDCFTITEMVIYEDLGFCPRGKAKEYIDSGAFTLEGELPVNPDGGLKCFGHPIGASGLRMMFEVYKQLQGKAESPARQLKNPTLGLTHNLGGDARGCIGSCNIAGL